MQEGLPIVDTQVIATNYTHDILTFSTTGDDLRLETEESKGGRKRACLERLDGGGK